MTLRELYPNATEPTTPRFSVGDVVYTKSVVSMPHYSGIDPNDHTTIEHVMTAHGYTSEQVRVEPAVFGVIMEVPEAGTEVLDCQTLKKSWDQHTWCGVEDPHEEAELDLPNSGSIWFLPDNERRYFVKWINKQPYQYTGSINAFTPLKTDDGKSVCNISLYPEDQLYKAPNFITKLRKKVVESKSREVERVLNDRLNIDECSTKGITSIVSVYC